MVFASEIAGHLEGVDEAGEFKDPLGLIASSLDHMSELSALTSSI